ncbi:MAG: spore coat protein CotJB [Lachnospiraceae bacterium]
MKEQKWMEQVANASFAAHEAVLFLDTHPEDRAAMNFYQQWRKQAHEAMREYEENIGPLFAFNVNEMNYWAWIKSPWPWELEANCGQRGRKYSAMSLEQNTKCDAKQNMDETVKDNKEVGENVGV